jgi:hypothetical protein
MTQSLGGTSHLVEATITVNMPEGETPSQIYVSGLVPRWLGILLAAVIEKGAAPF